MKYFLHTNKLWVFLGFAFLIQAKILPQSTGPKPTGKKIVSTINYSIEPFYDQDKIMFIVTMEFDGNKSGETPIIIPNEYGGNENIEGITNLKALSNSTYIIDTETREQKIIRHPANSKIKLQYRVEEIRGSDIELGNHYMVTLNKQYFHFLGETFFIVPSENFYSVYNFRISWVHMPQNWNLANSFGVNEKEQFVSLPLWKFRYSVFTGGDFRINKKTVGSNPVYIAIRGNWGFSDNQFSDMIYSIIKSERDFWQDHQFPYFLTTVIPIDGSGDQGGTGRTNSFALFLSNDRVLDYRIKRLLAHETFHTWLGAKITFSEPEHILYWFKEGFTDYYARLILLRTNLISLENYADEYNKVLKKYYTSPVRFENNSRIEKEFWSDSDIMNLPYQRGDIIAHNLNAVIQNNSNGKKSLDNLMLDIFKRCSDENLVISTGSLMAMIRHYTDDNTVAEILRTINTGAPLKANPAALGSCFKMEIDSYKKFWLIGEKYEVPVYNFRNEDLIKDKSCYSWFSTK